MIKQVLVVRKDLNMRKGKIAAQCAHASLKVFLDAASEISSYGLSHCLRYNLTVPLWPEAVEWLEGAFTKICVSVDSEEELHTLHRTCNLRGIPNAIIRDSGDTEFHGVPTYTVLAIGPYKSEEIDKLTGSLKLL